MPVHITRRAVLGGSAGVAALGSACAMSAAVGAHPELSLFVFQAPGTRNPVLAAVVSWFGDALPGWRGRLGVRLHFGQSSWRWEGSRLLGAESLAARHDGGWFAGEARGRHIDDDGRYAAFVLEVPPDAVPAGRRLDVWSEIRAEDGSRARVGNPFVAALVAGDRALATAYHAASPAQDRVLLGAPLARRIAALAAARGVVADPHAHGARVAAHLLPDVVGFRADLPAGFTFANRNGRHPADATASVVATVLTGAVAHRTAPPRFRLTEAFPYFS